MNLIALRDVTLRRGTRTIVDAMSFSAGPGETVALMGSSGAGKSTVLRAIAGLDPIAGGTIDLDGLILRSGPILAGRSLRELHRRVGIIFQFHHLFAHKSAFENVWLAPVHVLGQSRDHAERRARELLAQMGVEHRADAHPHELSGGEAQRVAIARSLAMEPPLLLMDEPTASLDPERRNDLAVTLRGLSDQGRTLIVATHDVAFARALTDRTITLDSGRVVGDTRGAEVS